MRKFLLILGGLFLALIFATISTFGYLGYEGGKLDRESKAYVDQAIPAIVSDWSVAEMRRRASAEFLRGTKPDDLQNIFVLFAKLGPLVEYGGSKGDATIFASVGGGQQITGRYVAQATFKNGRASIEIVVRKVDGVWKVQSFRVDSPAMIESAVGRGI